MQARRRCILSGIRGTYCFPPSPEASDEGDYTDDIDIHGWDKNDFEQKSQHSPPRERTRDKPFQN